MSWKIPIALCLALMLSATTASAGNFIEPSDVDLSAALGPAPNVSRLRNIWMSGQPAAADLEAAKEEGITVVINLRMPGEITWDERTAVEALGMTYYHLPVNNSKPFSRTTFDMIDVIMAERSSEQVLIHCSTANRVGAWLATYLVREKGTTIDAALLVARRAGMKNKSLEAKVRDFLRDPAP